MTKEFAVFETSLLGKVLAHLIAYGYRFTRPHYDDIVGYDRDGEPVTFETIDSAVDHLHRKMGLVQLWLDDNDLAVSTQSGKIHLFFDGYTKSESAEIMMSFRRAGLAFDLDYDA